MVVVRLYGQFRDYVGGPSAEVDGSTIEEILRKLADEYNGLDKEILDNTESNDIRLKDYVKVLVNGRSIDFLDGVSTEIKNEDEVVIFPPVGGG